MYCIYCTRTIIFRSVWFNVRFFSEKEVSPITPSIRLVWSLDNVKPVPGCAHTVAMSNLKLPSVRLARKRFRDCCTCILLKDVLFELLSHPLSFAFLS